MDDYELKRARDLLEVARAIACRRLEEREDALARVRELEPDAALGRAIRGLVEQLERLRAHVRSGTDDTMAFGIDPADVANVVRAEVDEVEAEQPRSPAAKAEAAQVLAGAVAS